MSLQRFLSRTLPDDIARVGKVLFPETNPYRLLGDHFNELFPEESVFAPMYAETGRGALPPLLMALVTVFQMLEKVPDRLAAQQVVSRMDWKYALHLPLTYPGFHFTDLSAFRQRLFDHAQERLLFEQLLLKLKELGLLKAQGKMRTDSTHVLGVVERLSQLELLRETLRMAVLATTAAATDWVAATLPPAFRDAYRELQSAFGLSASEVLAQSVQAGQDGFWFLAQVERSAPPVVGKLPEVELLRTVWAQQFPQGPGTPPRPKRVMGADIIESPHEPEARYAIKRGKDWLGYKMQVTETCEADLPHLIVDLEPTGALDNDAPELPAIQARLEACELLPSEQQVDQGYMSAANLVDSAAQGITLMGTPLDDTQGVAGFRQADFQIEVVAQQATCPAGQTSTLWSVRTPEAGRPPGIQVRFEAARCAACPYFGRCTTSLRGRTLNLHPYREVLQARRAEAQTVAFREKLHLRAGIEGAISELVRAHGLRRARYRGEAKLRLQGYFTAIAANLKRLVAWWTRAQKPVSAAAAA